LNNLAYDDYFQRHASEYSAGSNFDDYFQRHASEYSAGSNFDDYFQRHPLTVTSTNNSTGLDWYEQRLLNYSDNRDWIERHR
jgi:hypothetical protein